MNELDLNNINPLIEDKSLLKLYIGKNYDKIINKRYSYITLFFCPFKMFYHHMILQGFFMIIIEAMIMILLPYYYLPIIYALSNLIGATFYNNIYLSDAKYKIYKICAKENDTTKIIENINRVKNFNFLKLSLGIISYVILLSLSFIIHDSIDDSYYGHINNLYFSYPKDYIIERNVLRDDENTCQITFNYSQVTSLENILNYYHMQDITQNKQSINNENWYVYKQNNQSLYVYTSYNHIYFVMTNDINNHYLCQNNINNIVNTFTIVN